MATEGCHPKYEANVAQSVASYPVSRPISILPKRLSLKPIRCLLLPDPTFSSGQAEVSKSGICLEEFETDALG
jgi:hypothetical protein